jgi:hypothetical protein
MNGSLELALLGRARVGMAGSPFALPTRKSLALLACLAITGPAPRGMLAETLRSGLPADAARRNLRQELHCLQKTPLAGWIVADAEMLAMHEGFVLDVARWCDALAGGAVAGSFARMLAHTPGAHLPAVPAGIGPDPLIAAVVEPLHQWQDESVAAARHAAAVRRTQR